MIESHAMQLLQLSLNRNMFFQNWILKLFIEA